MSERQTLIDDPKLQRVEFAVPHVVAEVVRQVSEASRTTFVHAAMSGVRLAAVMASSESELQVRARNPEGEVCDMRELVAAWQERQGLQEDAPPETASLHLKGRQLDELALLHVGRRIEAGQQTGLSDTMWEGLMDISQPTYVEDLAPLIVAGLDVLCARQEAEAAGWRLMYYDSVTGNEMGLGLVHESIAPAPEPTV